MDADIYTNRRRREWDSVQTTAEPRPWTALEKKGPLERIKEVRSHLGTGFCCKAPYLDYIHNLVNSTAWTRDTSILAWTKAENKGRYDSSPSLGQRNVVFNSVVFVSNSRFQLNRAVACPTSPKASRAAKDQNNDIAAVIALRSQALLPVNITSEFRSPMDERDLLILFSCTTDIHVYVYYLSLPTSMRTLSLTSICVVLGIGIESLDLPMLYMQQLA